MGLKFPGQYLYSNLYYSPKQKKLYLAVHQAEVSGKADIDIYELNFPPIPVSSFKQSEVSEAQTAGSNKLYVWLCIIGGLLAIGIGTLYYRKKRTILARNEESKSQKTNVTDKAPNALQGQEKPEIKIDMPINMSVPTFHNYDFSRKCICFFGGFRVIDKEGNDITFSFTPTLKYLLILLILYTGKDSKGIIGNKLIQLLWYDKTEESAKNNRNVYMSKLRSLLDKVGDIKILNQNGFWEHTI